MSVNISSLCSCRIRYFSQYFDRPDWQCLFYEIFRLWAEYWIEPIPRRPNIKWPSKLNSSPQDSIKRRWQRQRHIQDTYKDKDNEKAQISSDYPSLTHLLRTIPKGDDKDRDKDERRKTMTKSGYQLATLNPSAQNIMIGCTLLIGEDPILGTRDWRNIDPISFVDASQCIKRPSDLTP